MWKFALVAVWALGKRASRQGIMGSPAAGACFGMSTFRFGHQVFSWLLGLGRVVFRISDPSRGVLSAQTNAGPQLVRRRSTARVSSSCGVAGKDPCTLAD